MTSQVEKVAPRTYVVSLENRKRRGAGCERPAEILKAARELFLEHGVENVTTRQIAARVGISQTALYMYFGAKEQMLDSLAKEAWRGVAKALEAVDPAGADRSRPTAHLRTILAAFMRHWLERPDDFRIVVMRRGLRNTPTPGDDGPSLCNGVLRRLADWAKLAADAGELQFDCSLDTVALTMWAAASGPVALRLAYPELPWPPEDEQIDAILQMIFRGCDRRSEQARQDGPAAPATAKEKTSAVSL